MVYNIDFLVAALIFLVLILYHYMIQNKVNHTNSNIFTFFLVLTISDVFLDVVCTVLITLNIPSMYILLKLCLTLLYILQVMVPYALLIYTRSLRTESLKLRDVISIWAAPPAFMILLILANWWGGLFFRVDRSGYYRGPLYLYMYFFALVYVAIVAVESIVYYKKLGLRKFSVIWEFLIIGGSCVLIQAFSNDLLMTGFGLALGITVLFLTINNPYEYTDNLTGAFDVQFFTEWFQKQLNKGKYPILLILDLPQLREINAAFGNLTGDTVLVETARKMKEVQVHQVFRIKGDRFLMAVHTLEEYERARNELRKFFSGSFELEGRKITVPCVICGVMDYEKLETCDDVLMYIEYLTAIPPEQDEPILIQSDDKTMQGFRYQKEVESFLSTAIQEDLFEVYYQPVYSIRRGGYVTLEALSRLRHPRLGPIPPDLFIQLAERTGQIDQIGYLQFKKICRFLQENRELLATIQNVKFNLSPAELLKTGHSQLLIDTIREHDLPSSCFQFEITETVATEYSEIVYQAIKDFDQAGIGLCLDDFGSGYANLNTVLKMPFSAIKLDRSLLDGILENRQVASFYENIVGVLKNMGYYVIAEGIETEQQVELISSWGVDMVQGFYFSRPLSGDKLLGMIRSK